MFRFISRSKLLFPTACLFVLVTICSGCFGVNPNDVEGKKYVIYPYDYDSKADLKWSEYLYNHLKKRGGELAPVFYDEKAEDANKVYVHLDEQLGHDYKVERKGTDLYLTAPNVSNTIWLLHQYMRFMGDADNRFPVQDLPAAILSFNDTIGGYSFNYRDVYAPPSLDEDMRGVLDLNNIDESWGIWGHNLGVTITDKSDQSIYASIKGVRNADQYCFTSEKLYRYVDKYISTNYSKDKSASMNFAILPNDNNLVCQCPGCVAAGNTPTNATPAVTQMIKRLAHHFKQHKFFTSAYHTTKVATDEKLPSNVGVLMSVIDWQPSRKENDRQKIEFEKMLSDWRQVCNHIYIWDYINNYDDYFTPYPILWAMQDRFKFYKEKGIEGIFLNGSGYDYSTFSDMETCVLAQLMMNVDLDVETLIRDYYHRKYPVAGTVIADFYLDMLKRWSESGKVMPYYGGINDKVNVYLDPDTFVEFYNKIISLKRKADEDEAYLLRRLITTLSYTRLELARYQGFKEHGFAMREGNAMFVKDEVAEWLEVFNDGYKAYNLVAVNESGDKSADYVSSWQHHLLKPKKVSSLIFDHPLTVKCEQGTFPTPGLTDGELGLPVNYYYGWNILPYREISINIPTKGATTIAMNFFSYIRHRIQVPSKIELYSGNKLLHSERRDTPARDGAFQTRWEKELRGHAGGTITLKLYSSGKYHIAIDEILLTN